MLADKKDQRELILFVHNIQQSLVLLNKAVNDNRKLLNKVLESRENSRRAGEELLNAEDKIFSTRGEKLLFLKEMNNIADSTSNIAGLLSGNPISIPSSLFNDLKNLITNTSQIAKSMNFSSFLDTGEIMDDINEFQNTLMKKDLKTKQFFVLNKIVDNLKQIIYGLEKANQF